MTYEMRSECLKYQGEIKIYKFQKINDIFYFLIFKRIFLKVNENKRCCFSIVGHGQIIVLIADVFQNQNYNIKHLQICVLVGRLRENVNLLLILSKILPQLLCHSVSHFPFISVLKAFVSALFLIYFPSLPRKVYPKPKTLFMLLLLE